MDPLFYTINYVICAEIYSFIPSLQNTASLVVVCVRTLTSSPASPLICNLPLVSASNMVSPAAIFVIIQSAAADCLLAKFSITLGQFILAGSAARSPHQGMSPYICANDLLAASMYAAPPPGLFMVSSMITSVSYSLVAAFFQVSHKILYPLGV